MKAKDLAKKLGVSPATISLVLNNKPGISDSLRKSLLEKIQELGHEEMLCDACRAGSSPAPKPPEKPESACACKVIAYLVPGDFFTDRNDPYDFFSGVLEGVEAEAWENDCCLVMVHMNRNKEVSLAEKLLRAGNVIGAIVHPCRLTEELGRAVQEAGLPFVFMDAGGLYSKSTNFCWEPSSVCISNRQGMYRMVKYLKEMGHTKLGYAYSGWGGQVRKDRRFWYEQALKDFGLANRPDFSFSARTGEDLYDYQALAEQFQNAKELPTALVCENDRQAWRAVKALKQVGLRVPEDISVVGFDDQPVCTKITPHLTTIRNSPQLMGRECVLTLQNLIRLRALGEPDPWLRLELPARLIERDSVRDLRKSFG